MTAPAPHHYTSTGLDSRKIAIWAFIGSECMLFTSLISTYLIYKGRSRVGPFPHETWVDPSSGHHFNAILNIPVTSRSTSRSSCRRCSWCSLSPPFKTSTSRSTREANEYSVIEALAVGDGNCRTTFLGFQAFEFTRSCMRDSASEPIVRVFVFTLTGFHGAHVTAGVIWLLTCCRSTIAAVWPKDALNVDIAALYWHFVDVVWIADFHISST